MNLDFPKLEKEILKFWKKKKIFEKLRKKNQNKENWSFLDGPITANNPMGVHHAWGRTYKDVFQRYKAMKGFNQRYQNGFDCQGLWVEVEVEKELGFKSKKDIEKFGIGKFVESCKKRVLKYSEIQTRQSIRLGQWMDWENSYYTMSDENNYAIWGFLKECRQKGLLYKGKDVVPWCIRCGTAISQHEILTEEYKEITHKAVFVKLPVIGKKNTYLLVWTTTPWTLPANVSAAVHPKLKYAEVKDKNNDIYILLKEKANLIPDGKIIKEFFGEKLNDMRYQGIFDELEEVKKSIKKQGHKVILWKDVSEKEGTGIVHSAPGCGQEDFQLSKEFNLPVIDPADSESRYKKGFGFLTGKLVTEVHPHTKREQGTEGAKINEVSSRSGVGVNDLIFDDLSKKGFVFKIEDYTHRYPTCWRCKSELIFRLVDEWYIAMSKLREPLMKVAKQIEWIPSFGIDRELDWLKNMADWLISKKRYWGLSLPIYECDKCGNFEVIGSREELKERAVSGWKDFEKHSPHRPWIDKVKIKCSKCQKAISRIPDVGNPWLDAGIVPFSTMGYYRGREDWQKWFPADLICESFPGQFKNWFYAIIVMSTVLENTNPTKTIFGYALVRDEKGEEMHKSKGNAVWFDEAVEKIGADPMRWMYARQNPVYNLKFGYTLAEETKRKLLTLYNIFSFFNTYVDKKEIPREKKIKPKSVLDKWIVLKLNNLIEKVSRNLNKYNVSVATLAIEKFFINDLSLWYVRRSRKRFHSGHKERKEAIKTLYYLLLNLDKMISPIMPFFTEEMYSELKTKDMPESIHLCDWPETDKEMIDKELEEKMEKVREIVALVLAERVAAGIKVRQPLKELRIKNQKLRSEKELLDLIKEEVNFKKIIFDNKIKKEVEIDTKITKELEKEGIVRDFIRNIQKMKQKAGCLPRDKIIIHCFAEGELKNIIESRKDFILKETAIQNIDLKREKVFEPYYLEVKVGKEKAYLKISKVYSKNK